MKKITMMLAIAMAAMAISCSKDSVDVSNGVELEADAAYVSLTISSATTRADDGTTVVGTTEESKVYTIGLIAFDVNYDYIGAYQSYVSDSGTFDLEVAPDARRFFAVVNPTSTIWSAISAIASFSQAEFSALPALTMTAESVSTENYKSGSTTETRGFTMVNCGSKNTSGILLESLVSVDTTLSDDIEAPTPITIVVDRLVSKFQFSISSSFEANTTSQFGADDNSAVGEVIGVALTATNKATYLYSMILTDELVYSNVYRTDHNMTVGQSLTEAEAIVESLEENFNWLKNENSATDEAFISTTSTPEYVLENTCEPSYSNSNNLTQAIVKAYYNPTMTNGEVLALGTSWFKIYTSDGTGTLYLTFDEIVALYNDKYEGFSASDETKASMDVQLQNIMNNSTITWAEEGLTLAALDARPYGGYKAATVASEDNYVVQYYQNAINYYDIFIQHDDTQSIGHVGRWGMVRNNSYSMDITGILQEGLPYIPDPTDPTIVDPENQDPTDPEPADKLNAYISVSISVNPWVIWTQESALM